MTERPANPASPPPAPAKPGSRKPAFALPLVVLLSMTVALVAAVMLERVTMQAMTVERQLDSYRSMHQARGIREVIDFWLNFLVSRRVSDSIADDGRAVDLQLADGSTVAVFVSDGQGAVLSDFAGLRDEDHDTAQLILTQLRADAPGLADTERTYGPVAISVGSALPEVLTAASVAIAGPDAGKVFAQTVLELRATKRLTSNDLAEAASKAQVQDEARGRILRAITADPTLWRVTAEVRGKSGALLGKAQMDAISSNNRRATPGQRTPIVPQSYRWTPAEDVTTR